MITRTGWIAAAAAAGGLAAAGAAHAQSAGQWLLRGGVTYIEARTRSGDLTAASLPSTKVDVGNSTRLSGGLTYMLTDDIGIDAPLALPFRHDIVGASAIGGVGKIGDVHALPITLLAQYRLLPASSAFRPYVGAGLTYAKFYKEKATAALSGITGGSPANPTTLSVKSRFGPTLELGASYAFNSRWYVDAAYAKTFLKTKATLSTGQTIDVKLDPNAFMLGLGYRF
jgi:outer membrane protein